MRKPAIPSVPKVDDPRDRFDGAVKETLEIFKGERGAKISLLLPATATTEQIALKVNELLALLQ